MRHSAPATTEIRLFPPPCGLPCTLGNARLHRPALNKKVNPTGKGCPNGRALPFPSLQQLDLEKLIQICSAVTEM